MATLRTSLPRTARGAYTERMRHLHDLYGDFYDGFGRIVERLDAGEPVVVHHGWELGLLPSYSGPWLLLPDGNIEPIEAIRQGMTITNYRRADGSLVLSDSALR